MMLTPHDFPAFFQEVHGHAPFPWQARLVRTLAEEGRWPRTLALPTGSGKTAALDIAVFHLALEAEAGPGRRAPVRIAFVVDRRLIVDDAHSRAQRLAQALASAEAGPVSRKVAEHLKKLAGDDAPPLVVRRLRGGIPREDDWARTPAQPTVLCSTVDQVGSRLLFRGYGVSDAMKPVHAGLLGSDCLLLLDEAHLAEPFRQTLDWVETYRGPAWREGNHAAPWNTALLTATPGDVEAPFALDLDDRAHPLLSRRLAAAKPVRLVLSAKVKSGEEKERSRELRERAAALVAEVKAALEHFGQPAHGATAPAMAVIVNRVARAREVHQQLNALFQESIRAGAMDEPLLLIGPARPLDRDDLAELLGPLSTGAESRPAWPRIVVATQCLEAGVDLDLDAVITEAAPIDALRQRFGRLNRAGRAIAAYGAIVAQPGDLSARHEDPVYGKAIRSAWAWLAKGPKNATVDFGIDAFRAREEQDPIPPEALAPRSDAPVLLPAHLDLLSQTSPVPLADPEVALYLHGPDRQPDAVTVTWRADIESLPTESVRRLLLLAPPRSAESVQLPLWTVRRWLQGIADVDQDLADLPGATPGEDAPCRVTQRVFRWSGDDERSDWLSPGDLSPGDAIVVPARVGGLDQFGWIPSSTKPVIDLGARAERSVSQRRFAVRVPPDLCVDAGDDAMARSLAGHDPRHWRPLRDALLRLPLPEETREALSALDLARRRVEVDLEVYGTDAQGRPRGIVFLAPQGLRVQAATAALYGAATEGDEPYSTATEGDEVGSAAGFPLPLREHLQDVEECAAAFATRAGLPDPRVRDLKLAASLHDVGKSDRRFQAWMYHADPLGPDPEQDLAKSGRPLPPSARSKAGLPVSWRHEALSVRLARDCAALSTADDPDLVLWLVGTHHGHGRPFFPHRDPQEDAPDVGPQSLAFDWQGLDWPSLFERLKARYGVWDLARLEAVLRLADHRASEASARREVSR